MRPTNPLHKQDYHVEIVPLATCQELCRQYHYAKGGSNTATFRHGLFHNGNPQCLGIAWWIPPTKSAAIANFGADHWQQVISLSRLVLAPDLPTNAATFLLGQSEKLIRRDGRYPFLLTYADEWQGHKGQIYRAANWDYRGKTAPEALFLDPTGRMVARKAGPKTRTRFEMEVLGYRMAGRYSKHRFTKVLD